MKDNIMNIYSKNKVALTPRNQPTEYIIGSDLLNNLFNLPVFNTNSSGFILVSDTNVFKLYGHIILKSLNKLNKKIISITIPSGERYKTYSEAGNIITCLLKRHVNRNFCLISLGGGVVSDIGGFVASILFRGIKLIQIPTTLLAQIDASLGGKTGVDYPVLDKLMYKNILGTFYQPSCVISDLDTLQTLPKSEILNGLGEMVKYWVGWKKPEIAKILLVEKLISNPVFMSKIILDCQKTKLKTVVLDPYDNLHIREKLNLGHTIGHAIEGASLGKLSHGQSVAIGLVASATISLKSKLLSKVKYDLIIEKIKELGLPASAKNIELKLVLDALNFDKKVGTYVLITDIGKLITGEVVRKELILKVLQDIIL